MPPAEAARSLKRESGLISSCTQHAWWGFVRSYLKIYHRVEIHGREHLPLRPPFVLVANHSSHLDAMLLAAFLNPRMRRHVFPIAAGDVFFETPAMSVFSASCINALPMWRNNCGPHALKELREKLIGEPAGYILFPEGTRSRDGAMAHFKAGIGMLVAGTPAPVVPCFIDGAHLAMPSNTRMPRPRKVRLFVGEPIVFEQAINRKKGWQEVVEQLEAAVCGLRVKCE